MLLCDVNVFVNAHRPDTAGHAVCREFLERLLDGSSAFGISELVLSGFLRVVTHPGIFRDPTPGAAAFEFVRSVREHPNAVSLYPGERHWGLFETLCSQQGIRGNLVPDAYFAALAIESGSEWVTTDRDYARFPGLKWRTPGS